MANKGNMESSPAAGKEDIGSRLKRIRKKLGLKQKQLAVELKVSPGALCEAEAGHNKPGFDILFNLSEIFNVNIHYVLHGTGGMFKHDSTAHAFKDYFSDEQAGFLEKFLFYYKESELVRFSVMAYFKKYLLENAKLIEMEINPSKPEQKTKEQEDEEDSV